MLKTIEDVSSTKKRLHIEIPPDTIEAEIKSGLDRLKSQAKLPGFRPGKVPVALLEKRFGKEIEAEALEKVISTAYAIAVKESNIRPVSNPVFEKTDDFARSKPFSLTLVVEIMPKLEDIKYEGINVKKIPVTVEDADVENTLARLREDKAVYEPSEEPLKEGDVVVLDYETSLEGLSAKDRVFKVGNETMPKGFSEHIVGLSKGANKEFDVVFPEDYYLKEIAGKTINFKVSIKDTKKAAIPALDDDFAKDLGFDDLPKLKEHVRERLLHSKEDAVAGIMKAEIVKKILDAHPFEAPDSLVETELRRMMTEVVSRGGKEDGETMRKDLREPAARNTKASLVLQAIGEKEGIKVSDDDINQKIAWLSEKMSLTVENVMKYYITRDGSLEGLRYSMFEDRVLDLLLKKSNVEEAAL